MIEGLNVCTEPRHAVWFQYIYNMYLKLMPAFRALQSKVGFLVCNPGIDLDGPIGSYRGWMATMNSNLKDIHNKLKERKDYLKAKRNDSAESGWEATRWEYTSGWRNQNFADLALLLEDKYDGTFIYDYWKKAEYGRWGGADRTNRDWPKRVTPKEE